MARPVRIEFPRGFYHIAARGIAHEDMFFNDNDRKKLSSLLPGCHVHWGLIYHGYCLMTNHYHLDTGRSGGDLSPPLQWLNQDYARYVKAGHYRVGHLFQDSKGYSSNQTPTLTN